MYACLAMPLTAIIGVERSLGIFPRSVVARANEPVHPWNFGAHSIKRKAPAEARFELALDPDDVCTVNLFLVASNQAPGEFLYTSHSASSSYVVVVVVVVIAAAAVGFKFK
ncbi:hypothetical protein KQX54_005308 [Cotesia glomerata]|uniref:Uncharacterized protein n=1 Tax=Cotesia glomerata TaxID=32391 RepID=A0AAV7J5D1_COTGL|nr:hypothetical protein KQX54_005308 [Cotesia glomerata]